MDKSTKDEAKKEKKNQPFGIINTMKNGIQHSIDAAKSQREAPFIDLLTFAVTFLFAGCHVIFGAHPLAIAFLAILPSHVWIAMLGAACGSLILGKPGIIYAMISVVVVLLRVVVSSTSKESRENTERTYLNLFSEGLLLKMSVALIGGFIAAVYEAMISGITSTTVLFGISMTLIPPVLTFALSGLFDTGVTLHGLFDVNSKALITKGKSEKEKFNVLFFKCSAFLLLFLISVSLKEYELLGVSLAYIFSAFATLVISRRFGALMGCVAGFVSSFGISGVYSVAFALMGISAGALFTLNLMYGIIGGGALLCVWCAYAGALEGVLTVLPEFLIASLVAHPILKRIIAEKTPEEADDVERSASDMVGTVALSFRNRYKGNLHALENSLSAMSSAIGAYNENSARPTREELCDLVLECRDKYCRSCEGFGVCISKSEVAALGNVEELADILYKNGKITADNLGAYPTFCRMAPGIAESINRGAAILAEEKFRESKKDTYSDDFSIISKLINEARLNDEREKALNDPLSKRLEAALLDAGLDGGVIRAFGERAPYFILAAEDESGSRITAPELKKNIESIAGIRLGTPEFYRRGKMALMECASDRSYAAECAISSIAGSNDEISGDTATYFESSGGYFYSIISDGMGSGTEAKEISGFVTEFMTKALEFSSEGQTVLKLLNHAVKHRHRECSATFDMFSLDLYRGEAEFIKSGAAPSYVKRDASIFRIKSKTAPLGLMKNVDAERIRVDLESDDYIIMLSDGIAQSAEDTPWLLDLLSKPPKRSIKEYADHILATTLKNMPKNDDMTVVVIKVSRRKD